MKYYVLFVISLIITSVFCMENDKSGKQEQIQFMKVIDTTSTNEPGQVLNLFVNEEKYYLLPKSSYDNLASLIGGPDRDIALLHQDIKRLAPDKKESIYSMLTSLKQKEKKQRLEEYLKNNVWVTDYQRILVFLRVANQLPGNGTDSVIDSLTSTTSSVMSSVISSPTPSYIKRPVQESQISITAENLLTQQQLQIQQQNQLNQMYIQLLGLAINENKKHKDVESEIFDTSMSVFKKCYNAELLRKIITVGTLIVAGVSGSVLSYIVGQGNSCSCN